MDPIIVIDTSSLINFTRFYYFDKYNEKDIYNGLIDFVITKIKQNKIIVLDKVYEEWFRNQFNKDIRDNIEDYIQNTIHLIPKVQGLITTYQHNENIRLLGWTDEQINLELDSYENGTIADLYLIACCLELKENKENPILITEETRKNDGKIIQKIPTICRKEHITYRNIPYSLFEIYKNELKFGLTIT